MLLIQLATGFALAAQDNAAAPSDAEKYNNTMLGKHFPRDIQAIIAGYVVDEWNHWKTLPADFYGKFAFDTFADSLIYYTGYEDLSRLNLFTGAHETFKAKGALPGIRESAISSDGRYLANLDTNNANLEVTNLLSKQKMFELDCGADASPIALVISPSNKLIACAFQYFIKVVTIANERSMRTFSFPGCACADLAVSSDDTLVAIITREKLADRLGQAQIEVINLLTEKVFTLPLTESTSTIQFIPGGHLLAVGSRCGNIKIIDVENNNVVLNKNIGTKNIEKIAFNLKTKSAAIYFSSHSENGYIAIWNLDFSHCYKKFNTENIKSSTEHLVFSMDGKYFGFSKFGAIEIWQNQEASLLAEQNNVINPVPVNDNVQQAPTNTGNGQLFTLMPFFYSRF